jgi:hypothetical protein
MAATSQEPLASKHGALFWFCDCRAAAATTAASAVAAEMAQCTLQEPKEELKPLQGS